MTKTKLTLPLKALMVTGVFIIPSAFLGAKISGIILLLFFLSVIWNLVDLTGGNMLSKLADDSWNKTINAKNNKKYFESLVYLVAFPMVIIGIAVVLLQIIFLMFFI